MNESTSKVLRRIKAVRETIAIAWTGPELIVEYTGKMNVDVVKPAEFISRNVFLAVMADVLNVAKSPDFEAIATALRDDPTAADAFSNELTLLKYETKDFQKFFFHYIDSVEVFKPVDESREALFSLLQGVYTTGDVDDAKELFDAIGFFVKANVALADDVYRDDLIGKTMELPSFDSDEPMTWPEPCESELTGPLPSTDERLKDELTWVDSEMDVTRIIAHTENDIDPVFMKDFVSRLWGKASRLVGGREISNKIRVQMPRWVMYPFYDELFHLACSIGRATSDYRDGVFGPVTGSSAIKRFGPPALSASIKNPWDRIQLPWHMEKLLLFAPREYFTPKCNHHAYMMLCLGLLNQKLGELCTVFPDFDTRDIARDVRAIEDDLRIFHGALTRSPSCTRREYMAQVNGIIDPVRKDLNRLSDDLYALECEMQKVKPDPKKKRKGCKHDTYEIDVTVAAKLTGIPAVTLYRVLKRPKNTLAVALNHSPEAVIEWGKTYKKIQAARKTAKHKANMMNHPIPMSSVSKGTRHKAGV